MKHSNKTDWAKLSQQSEKSINYTEIAETDASFWEDAMRYTPQKKVEIKLKIDEDIAVWITQLGENSNSAINNLLRSYYMGLNQFHFQK